MKDLCGGEGKSLADSENGWGFPLMVGISINVRAISPLGDHEWL